MHDQNNDANRALEMAGNYVPPETDGRDQEGEKDGFWERLVVEFLLKHYDDLIHSGRKLGLQTMSIGDDLYEYELVIKLRFGRGGHGLAFLKRNLRLL